MELEEAILKIQDIKKEYGTMDGLKEYVIAIDKVLKYIKEESMPRAVVEEKIKSKIQFLSETNGCNIEYTESDVINNEIDVLLEILNKGEK